MPEDITTTTEETNTTPETAATSIPENVAGEPFAGPATQEELDALLSKAREEAVAGFADYDTLKEQASNAEKLTTQLAEVQEQFNAYRLEAALREEAIKGKATNVDQVLALIDRTAASVNEEGQVTGAAEVVAEFLENNPHFTGQRIKPIPSLNEKTNPPKPTLLTDAELREYQKNPAALAADPDLFRRYRETVEHKRNQGNAK